MVKMTKITFYGGIGEIGGNKILVEDGASFFLDFGKSFDLEKKYFGGFFRPTSFRAYAITKMIPMVYGWYRPDLLETLGPELLDEFKLKIHKEPVVDAILLSHCHTDHSAYVSFLDGRIPVYASLETKRAISAFESVSQGSPEKEIIKYDTAHLPWEEYWYRETNKKKGKFYLVHKRRREIKGTEVKRYFNFSRKFSLGNIDVERYPVDHSTFDACGYILYTYDFTIGYTGDIRFNGLRSIESYAFIERLKEERIDGLIIECTKIDSQQTNEDSLKSEYDVLERSKKVMENNGLVIIDCSYRDLDRLSLFLEAAESSGRRFLVSPKTIKYLWYLKSSRDYIRELYENVFIYEKPNSRVKPPKGKEDEIVSDEEIRKRPAEYALSLSYENFGKLFDLCPFPPKSVLIHSESEPHDEEGEIEYERMLNWCDYFNIKQEHIHCSGHINKEEIREIIADVRPKFVFPIHTKNPHALKQLIKDVKIIEPEFGKTYKFGQTNILSF